MQKPRPEHIANNVRLKRQENGLPSVIVEAGPDVRFYRRFVLNDSCDFTFAHGKENALSAVSILEADGFTELLAIIDADFDRLTQAPATSSNIIRTDHHDLETILIESSAFDKVLGEFGSRQKCAQFEETFGPIRRVLFDAAKLIGCLRLYSAVSGMGLSFDKIRYERFIDGSSLSTDLTRLVTTVKGNSGTDTPDVNTLKAAIREMETAGHDLRDLCNGHDLTGILTVGLRGVLGSRRAKGLVPDALEMSLRLAYEAGEFFQTQICAKIKQWESRAGVKILRG